MNNIREFVDGTIDEFINETFQTKLETEYEVDVNNNRGLREYIFTFKTNSGTEYCLQFTGQLINGDTLIDGKNKLNTITKNLTKIENEYFCVEIGFTIKKNFKFRRNNDKYLEQTNKNEPFELLSRISYLVDIYQSENNRINLYFVSRRTNNMNLTIYKTLFRNIFSNNFKMFESNNSDDTGGLYFINKNNLMI